MTCYIRHISTLVALALTVLNTQVHTWCAKDLTDVKRLLAGPQQSSTPLYPGLRARFVASILCFAHCQSVTTVDAKVGTAKCYHRTTKSSQIVCHLRTHICNKVSVNQQSFMFVHLYLSNAYWCCCISPAEVGNYKPNTPGVDLLLLIH